MRAVDPTPVLPGEAAAIQALPRAWGGPFGSARFRTEAQDFLVEEQMRIPEHPTGAHWWLQLRKTHYNTKDVATALTGLGPVSIREIGYAGLKDRHAITTQWFSSPIEGLDPDRVRDGLPEGVELLDCKRARHAIRRGGLLGNRFTIRLRDFDGDKAALERGLEQTARAVPNYFGEQRFGRSGGNLQQARRLFAGQLKRPPRHERGLYLSAARSWLFNLVLAARVRDGSWNSLVEGEAVILDGSRSHFPAPEDLASLQQRLAEGDIHASGPLHGTGQTMVAASCFEFEKSILEEEPELSAGLEDLAMKAERRALRLLPEHFGFHWINTDLVLQFVLPSGCYATSVLRELVQIVHDETHRHE